MIHSVPLVFIAVRQYPAIFGTNQIDLQISHLCIPYLFVGYNWVKTIHVTLSEWTFCRDQQSFGLKQICSLPVSFKLTFNHAYGVLKCSTKKTAPFFTQWVSVWMTVWERITHISGVINYGMVSSAYCAHSIRIRTNYTFRQMRYFVTFTRLYYK